MLQKLESKLLGLALFLLAIVAFGLIAQLDLARYWPLLAAGAAVAMLVVWLIRNWWASYTRGKLLGDLAVVERMDSLSWHEFEQACAGLFEREGYHVSLTPASGDGGVDIILRRDGEESIVQCKHRRKKCLGVSEVRELLGAKHDLGADEAFMVTSGAVSREARKLADRNEGLYVWDRERLVTLARRNLVSDAVKGALSGEAPQQSDPPSVPGEWVCPRCGEKLVVRDGRYGRFIGCSGFPKCRYSRDFSDEEHAPA
jgi:restriction system protein